MGAVCGKVEKEENSDGLAVNKRDFVLEKKKEMREEYHKGQHLTTDKFAEIYKCKHKETKQSYIAKIYNIKSVEPKILEAFIKEAELLREADHPNIIKVIDIFRDPNSATIITEHCKGGELINRIKQAGGLTENQVAGYIKQILSALAYLHSKKIVHRDVRPEVFSFLTEEENSNIKLTDFGNCKHFEKNLRILERVGNPSFMAPEVVIGNYNSKCDIWSIGVMSYLLLSGSLPFKGQTESDIIQSVLETDLSFEGKKWKKISQEGKDIIQKMLNRNAMERPTAKQLLAHDWIKQRAEHSVPDNKIVSSALKNLAKFEATSSLQRATLAFIVSQIMSSEEIGSLSEVFKSIDTNGDGLLSRREIKKALSSHTNFSDDDINTLIQKVDLDANDKVNYSEFLAATIDWEKEMSKERLEKAFRALDQDHSGKISKEELMHAFGGSHTSSKIFEEMIEQADVNGDGEIDLEEFCQYMSNIKNKGQTE